MYHVVIELHDAAWHGVLSRGACVGVPLGLCNLMGGWNVPQTLNPKPWHASQL